MCAPNESRLSLIVAVTLAAITGCSTVASFDDPFRLSSLGDKSGRARHHLKKGIKAFELQNFDTAQHHFEQAALLDDSSGVAYNNLGLVHFHRGDLYAAATYFERATQETSVDSEPVYNLGLTFEQGGQLTRAMSYYEAAHLNMPSDPRYLGNLIRTRLRLGEPAELLTPELQQLVMLETRPEWREWANDLLQHARIKLQANDLTPSDPEAFLPDVVTRPEVLPQPGPQLPQP